MCLKKFYHWCRKLVTCGPVLLATIRVLKRTMCLNMWKLNMSSLPDMIANIVEHFVKHFQPIVAMLKDYIPSNEWFMKYNLDLETVLNSLIYYSGECWSCRECGKTTKKKNHIKQHAETHVSGLAHVCEFCNKTFKTRNTLSNHISLTHKEQRNANLKLWNVF